MTIPTHYYYTRYDGFSNIVRVDSKWSEESGGYQNEHIYETIACTQSGKYILVNAHLKTKTMGGEDFEISNRTEISKEEYEQLVIKHNGIIDNQEYREIFDNTLTIRKQIEDANPSCPKCGSVMTEREGRYGKFWGCTGYPECDGTRKDPESFKEKRKLWDELSKLNRKLSELERG